MFSITVLCEQLVHLFFDGALLFDVGNVAQV